MSERGPDQGYDTKAMADQAAEHGYDKHVVERREFADGKYGADVGVRNKEDYARHIDETLRDPSTRGFEGVNNRDQYYNERTNTVVVVNKDMPERSTCYRPDLTKETAEPELDRLKRDDDNRRDKLGLERAQIREGGYEGLHPTREQERAMEKQQEADKEPSSREQAAAKWEAKAPAPEPERAEDKPQREKADRETEREK